MLFPVMLWRAGSCLASRRFMAATVLGVLAIYQICRYASAPPACVWDGNDVAIPLLWITEAGNRSGVSRNRLQHLKEQSVTHGIRLRTISQISLQGEEDIETKYNITNQLLLNKLHAAGAVCFEASLHDALEASQEGMGSSRGLANHTGQFVLISQDDVHFHRQFIAELTCTLAELPASWRSLHLCPGYLWGKKHALFPYPEAGGMRPEGPVPQSNYSRIFPRIPPSIALGGPLAFVIRCSRVQDMVTAIKDNLLRSNLRHPDDVTLQRISAKDDYVARNPQLCVEWAQGGSDFADSTAHDALLPMIFELFLLFGKLLGICLLMLFVCIGISSLEHLCSRGGVGGKAV